MDPQHGGDLRALLTHGAIESPQQIHALTAAIHALEDTMGTNHHSTADLCTACDFVCHRILHPPRSSHVLRDSLVTPSITLLRLICEQLILRAIDLSQTALQGRDRSDAHMSLSTHAFSLGEIQSLQSVAAFCRSFNARLDPFLSASIDFCQQVCIRLSSRPMQLGVSDALAQLLRQLHRWPQLHYHAQSHHTDQQQQMLQGVHQTHSASSARDEMLSILPHMITLAAAACAQSSSDAGFSTTLLLSRLTPYLRSDPALVECLAPILNQANITTLDWHVVVSIVKLLVSIITANPDADSADWGYHGHKASHHQRTMGLVDLFLARRSLSIDAQWRVGYAIMVAMAECSQSLLWVLAQMKSTQENQSSHTLNVISVEEKHLKHLIHQLDEICHKWKTTEHPQLKLLELQRQNLEQEINKVDQDIQTIQHSIDLDPTTKMRSSLETQIQFLMQHNDSLLHQQRQLLAAIDKEWEKINRDWQTIEKDWSAVIVYYLNQFKTTNKQSLSFSVARHLEFATKILQASNPSFSSEPPLSARSIDSSRTLLEIITKSKSSSQQPLVNDLRASSELLKPQPPRPSQPQHDQRSKSGTWYSDIQVDQDSYQLPSSHPLLTSNTNVSRSTEELSLTQHQASRTRGFQVVTHLHSTDMREEYQTMEEFKPTKSQSPINHTNNEIELVKVLLSRLSVQTKVSTSYLIRLMKETASWKEGSERAMRSFLDSVPYDQLMRILDILRECAQSNNPLSQLILGYCYYNGCGFDINYNQSAHWFNEAADHFDLDAICHLGICYIEGHGVAQHHGKGLQLFILASSYGHIRSLANIGWCYEKGFGVKADIEKAIEYYLKAAQLGDTRGQTNVGFCYSNKGDHTSAVKWYRVAASKGDPRSQTNLGWCYERGLGVPADPKVAVQFYRLAADQGDHVGLTNLACCYANGIGVEQDLDEAIKHFQHASTLGNDVAKSNLVVCITAKELQASQQNHHEAKSEIIAEKIKPTTPYQHPFVSSALMQKGTQTISKDSSSSTLLRPDLQASGSSFIHESSNPSSSSRHQQPSSDKKTESSRSISLGPQQAQPFVPSEGIHSDHHQSKQNKGSIRIATSASAAGNSFQASHALSQPRANADEVASIAPSTTPSIPPAAMFQQYLSLANQGDLEALTNLGWCHEKGYGTVLSLEKAISCYSRAASAGHVRASASLGFCYMYGVGVPVNFSKAYELLTFAATKGDLKAITELGTIFENGRGVTVNYKEAFRLYKIAADRGHPRAMVLLGFLYEHGLGVDTSLSEAYKYYLAAADKMYPPGLVSVGVCYQKGRGVQQDVKEAVKYFAEAAKLRDPVAYTHLGYCFANGIGVQKNDEQTFLYFQTASQMGNATAQANLALCYKFGVGTEKNIHECVKHLKEAAANHDSLAELNLGLLHRDGEGVEKDATLAAQYFASSAEKGDPVAQMHLAIAHLVGDGIERDDIRAAELLRQSADHGHAESLLHLGWCYENGRGVESDATQAFACYEAAFASGERSAALFLGACYHEGHGTVQDDAKAMQFFALAADDGDPIAQEKLGWLHETGRGTPRDEERAFACYKRAADAGLASAQVAVALFLKRGVGVAADPLESFRYVRMAAENGHPQACTSLGLFYAKGKYVSQDHSAAAALFRQAADAGDPSGAAQYAACLENGVGVDKDLHEALRYYMYARDAGYDKAEEDLARVSGLLRS
eukprot:TRINITY_DN7372_c0_g1_i4.p1 TRINITY_DN7372_c0_g1~~TRINITY_DN7372_c0_g1_i4.p1  ORF type:complete len:1701 (+),score=346.69 TRINITY_DN7372_c0_g1_i4:70-5172(+)